MGRMHPVSVNKAGSGELIYDFGQNFAVMICAKSGANTAKVIFRHAEVLVDGELFVKPLRTAKATAVYVAGMVNKHILPD